MIDLTKKATLNITTMVFLCFLLTSTGWLSWTYDLVELLPEGSVEAVTMVAGYLLQALGAGIFALLARSGPENSERIAEAALVLHIIFMVPAVMSPQVAGALIFGFLMNIACGMIAGYYLYVLTERSEGNHKAASFGIGYGMAILVSWLLSIIGGGAIYYSDHILIICAALTIFILLMIRGESADGAADTGVAADQAINVRPEESYTSTGQKHSGRRGNDILPAACLLVFLLSVVNSSGFAFPSSDIGQTVNIEMSRLVYAAGLVIAGFATDRSRKYGAVLALAALIMPFMILSLRGESVSAVIFWALSYFTFGFYSVYRIILISDIASDRGPIYLSGAGLLIGRIGDALGEGLILALSGRTAILVMITAALFAVSIPVFLRVYQKLYIPQTEQSVDDQERLRRFAVRHDLSLREQEVLRLIMEEKANSEIAALLFISDSTVKFHIHNLLSKTGCHNRKELIAAVYADHEY